MVFTTFASDLLSCLLHLYSLVNLSKSIFSSSVNTCTAFAHTYISTVSSQLLPFISKTAFPLFSDSVVLAQQDYTRNEGLLNITAFER